MPNATTKPLDLLRRFKLLRVPIDVDTAAKMLGIRIVREDMEDDVSGLLVVRNGKAVIAVNSRHHLNRQRFTVAHEIGHYLLHHRIGKKEDQLFLDKKYALYRNPDNAEVYARSDGFSGDYRQEQQANQFAADLLMPEDLVRGYLTQNRLDLTDESDLYRLAVAFGVSEQAMSIRVLNLGLVKPA